MAWLAVSVVVTGTLVGVAGWGAPEAQGETAAAAPAPSDTASYAIGYDMARSAMETLRQDGVNHDVESLIQGFLDAVRGGEPAVSEADMQAALTHLERDVLNRLAQERLKNDPAFAAMAERNASQSADFLAELGRRDGAKQIDGGIWCVELKAGAGAPPQPADMVTITFTVRTADGRLVMERVGTQTRVSNLIEGGQRALTRMAPGARWLIGIPSEHAFGLGGLAPEIGPNQALLIDCTLDRVQR